LFHSLKRTEKNVKLQVFSVFAGAGHHRAVIYVSLCQLSELIRGFPFCFYSVFHLPIKNTTFRKMRLSDLNTNEY